MQIDTKKEKVTLSIITKPPYVFFKGCLVYYLKKYMRSILSVRRGPDAVLDGLVRALKTTDISFNVNPSLSDLSETVHVLSNVEALKSSLELKKTGKIRRIIAGPNMAILPTNFDSILCDKNIDIITLPSDWTRVAYIKSAPSIRERIHIWPVGVLIPEFRKKKSEKPDIILFIKTVPDNILNEVISELESRKINYEKFVYGSFKKDEYLHKLRNSHGLIYLQEVESQGIALQEAWSYDVPTLVWNRGFFTYPNSNIFVEGNISAPYLTDTCGLFFSDQKDFPLKLDCFLTNLGNFEARAYCTENLSDQASAKIYVDEILNKLSSQ